MMYWLDKLAKRADFGFRRQLHVHSNQAIDFYSNDYLGLTKNKAFKQDLLQLVNDFPETILGSTGARLVSGNSVIKDAVEEEIASIHGYDSALIFPTGYLANLALYSCIAHRHEHVFLDEQVHRSILDGFRLAGVPVIKFRHNDLEHLTSLLSKHPGSKWVVIESLYSMEGDLAPLAEIIQVCNQFQAKLMVDEAHAFGVFGLGFVTKLQIQKQVFACTITYGKAMGLHGAAILCSNKLKEYLINFAAPFVYSTALPDYHFKSIALAYRFIEENPQIQGILSHNIQYYKNQCKQSQPKAIGAIQPIVFDSSEQLLHVKDELGKQGILTYAMLAPAVPANKQCLRICLHATNSKQEIDLLVHQLHHLI